MKKFKIWRYELANGSTAMNNTISIQVGTMSKVIIRDHTYRAIIMSITFSVKNNSVADC